MISNKIILGSSMVALDLSQKFGSEAVNDEYVGGEL